MPNSAPSWAWLSLAGAVFLSTFTIQSALAGGRVGVAAAVNPDATSQPPGGETTTLRIGKAVL